jgi:hypothetical protein
MPLPTPEPGLVVSYEFLWSNEAEAGHEQGEKKRPAVIVLAAKNDKGQITVTVAPITHSEPKASANAVEVPPKVKEHLGLDSERSWIICDELNEFVWPGYDLYPIPRGRPGQFDYGIIPPALYNKVRDLIVELDAKAKNVAR